MLYLHMATGKILREERDESNFRKVSRLEGESPKRKPRLSALHRAREKKKRNQKTERKEVARRYNRRTPDDVHVGNGEYGVRSKSDAYPYELPRSQGCSLAKRMHREDAEQGERESDGH